MRTHLVVTTDDPVEAIETWYEHFEEGVQQSVEAALEIGRILCEQKQARGHGAFLSWLRENVSFISERTAQRWMKLHMNRARLKSDSVSDLTSAYKLLEAPTDNDADATDDPDADLPRDPDDQLGADDDQPDGEHDLVAQDGGDDDGVGTELGVIEAPEADTDDDDVDVDGNKDCPVRRRSFTRPNGQPRKSDTAVMHENVSDVCRDMERLAIMMERLVPKVEGLVRDGRAIRRQYERGCLVRSLREMYRGVGDLLMAMAERPGDGSVCGSLHLMRVWWIELCMLDRDFPGVDRDGPEYDGLRESLYNVQGSVANLIEHHVQGDDPDGGHDRQDDQDGGLGGAESTSSKQG